MTQRQPTPQQRKNASWSVSCRCSRFSGISSSVSSRRGPSSLSAKKRFSPAVCALGMTVVTVGATPGFAENAFSASASAAAMASARWRLKSCRCARRLAVTSSAVSSVEHVSSFISTKRTAAIATHPFGRSSHAASSLSPVSAK